MHLPQQSETCSAVLSCTLRHSTTWKLGASDTHRDRDLWYTACPFAAPERQHRGAGLSNQSISRGPSNAEMDQLKKTPLGGAQVALGVSGAVVGALLGQAVAPGPLGAAVGKARDRCCTAVQGRGLRVEIRG